MRYEIRGLQIPKVTTVLGYGAVLYAGMALVAAMAVVGSTTVGEAVSIALLAGGAAFVAAFLARTARRFARSGVDEDLQARLVRQFPPREQEETAEDQKAA